MDPGAVLMKALIAHKVGDGGAYAEAKLAKQQADNTCNIGRRLARCANCRRGDKMASMQDQYGCDGRRGHCGGQTGTYQQQAPVRCGLEAAHQSSCRKCAGGPVKSIAVSGWS